MIKLPNAKKVIGLAVNEVKRNSTLILTIGAGVGLFTTVVSAVKATPKAMKLIAEEEELEGYELEFKDKIVVAWKCYVPATLMGALTLGCIIGINSEYARKNAALASLLSLSEAGLKEYQAKVVETLGERKEQKIYDEVVQERLDKHPLTGKEIYITGNGETLCFEIISSRYFKSNIESLRKIQNDINYALRNDNWVTLNEVYSKMGLASTKLGNSMGWNVDQQFEFEFNTMLAEGGQPCLVIDYVKDPSQSFRN